jgi:diacylglycerol kinase
MASFFKSRLQSFQNAFSGWWYVIRSQKNAWIHAVVNLIVLVMGLWLQLSPQDWAVIILAIGLVWMAEFLNTALEAVVDLASPEEHILAKVSKDVGAAAVLIAALSSVIIGLLILGPPLLAKIRLFLSEYLGNL